MGPRSALAGLALAAIGCGEPAYDPALADVVDTGFDEVAQLCGGPGSPLPQTVDVGSTLDRPTRLVTVDAACVETELGVLYPSEVRSFVITDQDALGAYVDLPEGALRVAARAPALGLDTFGWSIP